MAAKRNVLVVDDDDIVHLISQKLLSTYRCIDKVYSAYNGMEALRILKDSCQGKFLVPEIVLMDLHMPVMDGFELIHEIREMQCLQNEKILTIMISSTLDETEIEKATALGVHYFFSKPLMLEKLQSVFRKEFP
jgi:CheY-like chemotaxis protein